MTGSALDAAFDADYRARPRPRRWRERSPGEGWTLTALATPGHTSNHLCFALPETGALFSGDHVMGWSTSVVSPPDGDMGDYMAQPGTADDARRPRLLPRPRRGGGEPAPAGARHARAPQAARGADPAAACAGRRDRSRRWSAAMYVGLDPRLMPAAERSVLAHLIDLHRRGLVNEEEGRWHSAGYAA